MTDDSDPGTIERFSFRVDPTAVMLFARSLGDDRAEYRDGSVVPPTFFQSSAHYEPNYPLDTLRPGWEPKVTPRHPGAGKTLHGEQRFTYHQPVKAGDVLEVTIRIGDQWEKTSGRGGSLGFVEQITEYRDSAGELCVTAVNVGVIPEKKP